MNRRDWTLLVVAAGNGAPTEPVQLQKALFLLGEKLPETRTAGEPFYEFEPYDYGPFSKSVYADAEILEAEGLLTIARPPQLRFNLYTPTPAGLKRAAELLEHLSPGAAEYVNRLMAWIRSLSFQQLVRAIYQQFPQMKENSVFQD